MRHYTIIIIALCFKWYVITTDSSNMLKSSIYFAKGIIHSIFRNCSLIIVHDNVNLSNFKDETNLLVITLQKYHQKDLFNLTPNVSKSFNSLNNVFKFRTGMRTYCSLVVTITNNVFDKIAKTFDTHITPNENWMANSNEDYYVFITPIENANTILYSPVTLNLKFKLVISVNSGSSLNYTLEKSKNCMLKESFYCLSHYLAQKSHVRSDVLTTGKTRTLKVLFPDFMKDFHGHTLRLTVATKLQAYLQIMKHENGIWILSRGPEKFLLETTMRKYNFTLRLFPSTGVDENSIGGTGSQLENGTWIGCVGDILHDKADFSTTATPNVHRNLIVGFTAPFSYGWLTFIVGKPEPTFSWKAIFNVFQATLWLIILSTFIVSTFIIVICEKAGKITVGTIVFRLFATVLSQSIRSPRKCAARVYFAFWLIFSMIMSTAFVSKLVISLTFPEIQHQPHSFRDLVRSDYKTGLHGAVRGGAGEIYLKNSTRKALKMLYSKINLNPGDEECYSQTQTKKFACVAYKQSMDYMLNKNYVDKSGNHDFFISPDSVMLLTTSWMIPKKAVFKQQFDSTIIWSRDSGLIEKWEKMDFAQLRFNRFLKNNTSSNNSKCAYSSSGLHTGTYGRNPDVNRMTKRETSHCSRSAILNFENIKLSLYVLTIGYIISTVTYFTEVSIRRLSRRYVKS